MKVKGPYEQLREEQEKIDKAIAGHPMRSQSLPLRIDRPGGGLCYGPPSNANIFRPAPPPLLPLVNIEAASTRRGIPTEDDIGNAICGGYIGAGGYKHSFALRRFTWDKEAETWKPTFRMSLVLLSRERFDLEEMVKEWCLYVTRKGGVFPLPHIVLSPAAVKEFIAVAPRIGITSGVTPNLHYELSPERAALYKEYRKKYFNGGL
jgi:hypothetical protein